MSRPLGQLCPTASEKSSSTVTERVLVANDVRAATTERRSPQATSTYCPNIGQPEQEVPNRLDVRSARPDRPPSVDCRSWCRWASMVPCERDDQVAPRKRRFQQDAVRQSGRCAAERSLLGMRACWSPDQRREVEFSARHIDAKRQVANSQCRLTAQHHGKMRGVRGNEIPSEKSLASFEPAVNDHCSFIVLVVVIAKITEVRVYRNIVAEHQYDEPRCRDQRTVRIWSNTRLVSVPRARFTFSQSATASRAI